MVVIIDYGVGNLESIRNMLKKCAVESTISSDIEVIQKASKYILPGIGSFDHGISNLRSASYFSVLESKILEQGTPILGVCLGCQLLAESSEEGKLSGLGWIRGNVVKFNRAKMENAALKVPHMGWSDVELKKPSLLFKDMYSQPRFYFVHSYHLLCADAQDELVASEYGYPFTAGVEKNNIIGVQFHPEKSHKYGMKLYENFVKYY